MQCFHKFIVSFVYSANYFYKPWEGGGGNLRQLYVLATSSRLVLVKKSFQVIPSTSWLFFKPLFPAVCL